MRWESQSVDADRDPRLPGFSEDVVIRRFDAPEALGTRFHEIRTKSAINRVPAVSRVPFEWTINPYRGCSHSCVYCQAGDTRILMADGTHRALADVREGDEIYGTERRGVHRHLTRTTVLAHWSTIKRAYRVTLADGTELTSSGDHRYLSSRGWRHVTGAEQGHARRPHLTIGAELVGVGRFSSGARQGVDYRAGYQCGILRGDVASAGGSGRAVLADSIATGSYPRVERDRELVRWPREPSDEWRLGFLAGIFDTEGSCSDALRISNEDDAIIRQIAQSLDRFGFDHVIEPARADGVKDVRLRGALSERLRFFHTCGPAISRQQDLTGHAIATDADLRVMSIEPLPGAMRLYDITTGTGDFIANGVVSHNCFARPTHEYLDFDAGRDFEREIIVKVNVPEVLRAELARPSWGGAHIAMGTNTDPYQWVEGRYKLMRGIWEAMRDFANPCSILTKSPLLLRDADLLCQIAERTQVSACLSVPTLDEKAWRATEPHTPSPRARLEAVAELNRLGIPTGILIAPLMPGINDAPDQIERIVALATEAGAVHIGGQTLFLKGSVREIFFEWLREHQPDLVERYERLYASGAYIPADERRTIELAASAPWARRRSAARSRHPSPLNLGDIAQCARGGGRRHPAPEEVKPPPQGSLF